MRAYLKDQGGIAVAVLLGLLALLVAGTGTAVAAATVVSIGDPTYANRVARVDGLGRLSVAPAPSTLLYNSAFLNAGTTSISSPTNATLVLTGLTLNETRLNGTVNGADLTVYLVQLATSPDGSTCTTNTLAYLARTELSSGTQRDVLGAAQVQVKPFTGQPKYCLGLYSTVTNSAADATTYYPTFTWSGYVAVGKYTGIGTFAAPTPGTPEAGLPPKQ